MARYVFKLPDMGEGTTEAEIAQWHVAVGDRIEEDQPLVDVTTDKAVVEIPAPVSGTVVSIYGAAGERVAVGSDLVELEVAGGENAEATLVEAKPKATASAQRSGAVDAAQTAGIAAAPATGAAFATRAAGERPAASPAVRQRARELGIELRFVPGSGPGGRISHADLDAYVAGGESRSQLARGAATPRDGVEEHKLTGIRRTIAERMQEANRRIPHFSYIEEVDMSTLEALRQHLNAKHAAERPKLTLLPFLMSAVARALTAHPEINARFDDENGVVRRHEAVHIGIATQTPNGLLVPVVRHAEARDLWDCAAELSRLTHAAREGKASRKELTGSTITITSLGALGGLATTPVINHPEVAIIGVNKLTERPVVRGGQIVVRKMMNLSSSFDHRVVDGWNAAHFVQTLKDFLEQPATLFIE